MGTTASDSFTINMSTLSPNSRPSSRTPSPSPSTSPSKPEPWNITSLTVSTSLDPSFAPISRTNARVLTDPNGFQGVGDGVLDGTTDKLGKSNLSSSRRRGESTVPGKPRWRTIEFGFYYVCIVVAVWNMARLAMEVSDENHPNFTFFRRRLKRGWIPPWSFSSSDNPPRLVDNSDVQYRLFRGSIPHLALLSVAYLGAGWWFKSRSNSTSKPTTTQVGGSNNHSNHNLSGSEAFGRKRFLLGSGIVILLILHGLQLPKILIILAMNYWIAKTIGRNVHHGRMKIVGPFATWGFNVMVLFANEVFDGYPYGSFWSGLEVLDKNSLKGILPRWHINFNITMLRLISFSMDYYWACRDDAEGKIITSNLSNAVTEKNRIATSRPIDQYSFSNYIIYILYPPLYIAGPIMTFNNFISQLHSPPHLPFRSLLSYLSRFVICFLTMEFILHYMYVVAIKDSSNPITGAKAWEGDTVAQLAMIGFWNLIIVWLKLLIPWRFFRLWALADGVDPPENMIRCMANNYSTTGFWRSWHRSYNLWLIRYLYLPLGGSHQVILSSLVVFTFVALWHDLSFKLLTWGWVVVLFILPEVIARKVLPPEKYDKLWWYRHVCALGGVGNILMMMTANLIGFVVGTEGVGYLVGKLFADWEGLKFLLITSFVLWTATQVMMEYREEEKRKGVYRRC